MSDELLTHQFFAPLIGCIFYVEGGDRTVALRLDDVTPLPPPRRQNNAGEPIPATDLPVRPEPFTLLFKGPPDLLLPQRTYRMTAESLSESLDIFVVPVGREPDAFVYQAVFG